MRKLAGPQDALADRFDEGGSFTQFKTGRFGKWVEYDHVLVQNIPHDADRFSQVRIVADHRRRLIAPLIAIVEQMNSKIHVRALLLGLDHAGVVLLSW